MEYPRLIHEYLDGELNPILEDKLFAEMAINQDVRSEFSRQLKLQSFTNNDLNSIDIPSDTTAAVFAGLGFSIPSASVPNVGFRYYWSWLQHNGFRKASIAMLILLSTIGSWKLIDTQISKSEVATTTKGKVVPMASSINLDNSNNNSRNNSQNISRNNSQNNFNSNNSSISKNQNIAQTESSHKSKSFKSVPTANDNNQVRSTLALAITDEDKNNISVATDENNLPNNESASPKLMPLAYSNINTNNNIKVLSGRNLINAYIPIFSGNLNNESSIDPNFEISWSKSDKYYGQTNNLSKDNSTFFQGNSFSIAYKFNSEHAIGIDLGEEDFYQEFNYHTGDQIATYKQMPNYFWGGLSYKYSPEYVKIGESIQPFAKVVFGGAKGGAIGKMQMGLTLKLSPSISAFAMGEYGTMIYNIRETIYQSNKYQLLYGLSLNF